MSISHMSPPCLFSYTWPHFATMSCVHATNVKSVFFYLFFLYVNMCISVSPSPTFMRSEPSVKHLQMDISSILTLTLLCVCVTMLFFSKIDLNCRFIPFNTRLNTLVTPERNSQSRNVQLFLFFVLYLIIFDHFLIILLPSEFFNIKLDNLTVRQSVICVKMFNCVLASAILKVC